MGKKKDRLKFIDKLVSHEDRDERLGKIVDNHYRKMNIFYELTDIISEKDPIQDWALDDCDEYLSIDFSIDDESDSDELVLLIEDFFSDKEDEFDVEITEQPHIINIVIKTIIDEEEYFYEYRPDTND